MPTWDILQRRYRLGPGRCALFKNDVETTHHLFLKFSFTKEVWREPGRLMQTRMTWEGESLEKYGTNGGRIIQKEN